MKKILFYAVLATIPLVGFGQILQQDFESGIFPPEGWIRASLNANETWSLYTENPITGTYSASVDYDSELGEQDERLITPAINLTNLTNVELTFKAELSYSSSITNDNYDFSVEASTDGGTTWTPIWNEENLGVFSDYVTQDVTVDLSAYDGESNLKLAFVYKGTNGTATYLDDIIVREGSIDTTFPSPYCGPIDFSIAVEPITRVIFADINNSSDPTKNGSPSHEDFTTIVANVEQGQTIDVALEGNTVGNFTNFFTVFVDWNQDEVFDETTERYNIGSVRNSNGTDGQQAIGTIDVPADAMEGETRMRVIKNFLTFINDSCSPNPNYGQAEDYTVNVSASTTGGNNNCEQGVASNSLERAFPFAGSNNQRLAADIDVDANTNFTINSIQINTRETATYFDVIFYEDNAGLPGNEIATFMAVTKDDGVLIGTGSSGSSSGREFYRYTLTLTSPILEGGNDGAKYWMEIKSDANAWEATNAYSLGENVAYSTNSTGNEWTAGSNEVIYDLYGTCEASNTVSTFPAPYCGPLEFLFAVEPITRVVFADIDNSSDTTVNGSPAHEDFTSIIGNVEQGQTIDVALEGNTAGDYDNYLTVFIDWNQDELFDEATERYNINVIINSDGTDGQQATKTISVPADAVVGETRMRVIKSSTSPISDSCSGSLYGQAEDYTLNVSAMVMDVSDLDNTQITFYPNPVKDILNISFKNEISNIAIYNMAGQQVMAAKLNASNGQINMASLPSGIYVVRAKIDGNVKTFKVIKK